MRADTDWLYVPRKDGGRGLMQVEGAYILEVMKLVKSIESKEDPLMEILRTYQINTNSILFQIIKNFNTYFQSKIR
jgi:hypothetical protein